VTQKMKAAKSGSFRFLFVLAGVLLLFALLLAPVRLRVAKLRSIRMSLEGANESLEHKLELNRKSATEMATNPDYLAAVASRELGMIRADEQVLDLPAPPSRFALPPEESRAIPDDRIAVMLAPLAYDRRVRYAALALAFTLFAAAVVAKSGNRDDEVSVQEGR